MLIPTLFLPGIIEHRDHPHSPIRYFTQEDINQGKVMYRPPPAAPHLQELMAFSFAGNALLSALRHPTALCGSTWQACPESPAVLWTIWCPYFVAIQTSLRPVSQYVAWAQFHLFIFSFIHAFRHTFNKSLFCASYVPITERGLGDIVASKKRCGFCSWWFEQV